MKQIQPPLLTPKQMYRIITLYKDCPCGEKKGNKIREIAKIMDRSHECIRKHINRLKKLGQLK